MQLNSLGQEEKAQRLVSFIESKKAKTKGVKEWIAKLTASGGLKDNAPSLVFPLLALALGEEPDNFICIHGETTNTEEIERKAAVVTPHIWVVGDVFDDTSLFFIAIEKKVVSKAETLDLSVAVTFASYYVFNLQYDASLSATLEFIQRSFVNLNPARGTKSQSKKTGVASNKVVGLLNAFQMFEWNF